MKNSGLIFGIDITMQTLLRDLISWMFLSNYDNWMVTWMNEDF